MRAKNLKEQNTRLPISVLVILRWTEKWRPSIKTVVLHVVLTVILMCFQLFHSLYYRWTEMCLFTLDPAWISTIALILRHLSSGAIVSSWLLARLSAAPGLRSLCYRTCFFFFMKNLQPDSPRSCLTVALICALALVCWQCCCCSDILTLFSLIGSNTVLLTPLVLLRFVFFYCCWLTVAFWLWMLSSGLMCWRRAAGFNPNLTYLRTILECARSKRI